MVLIGLKTTANEHFAKLLGPLVGEHTAIVTLQNGLGNEESLAQHFSSKQLLGGLCFVCLNRIAPGVVRHTGEGAILLGEFQRAPERRTHDLAAAFRHAGVDCKVTDNLARARWEKLVWNIAFNGLGVASAAGEEVFRGPRPECRGPLPGFRCLTTEELLSNPKWESLVRELMNETLVIANAGGHELPHSLADKMIERTRPMGKYKASTVIDFECGRPLELESLFHLPLREAQRAGVATPRLAQLCGLLATLDKCRQILKP